MNNRSFLQRWALLLALVATACAPAVPDLSAMAADTAASAVVSTTTAPPTTTTTSTSTAPTTSSTTTTEAPPESISMTAGPWRLYEEVRDLSGDQFEALVKSPVIEGDVTPALLARVGTIVSGHVDSEVGATLALWRSIEAQGERDLTGSSLQFEFDVAGFIDEYLALRFFSEESLTGAGAVKRQVTTLMVDLNSGVAIGLDDIIIDGDSRVALLVFVQEILLSDYFDGDTDAFNLWAGDLAPGDIDRAVLTPDGIEIWFDELEVGPPDIGTPVIAIPFDLIEGLLDPSGPVAVLGT